MSYFCCFFWPFGLSGAVLKTTLMGFLSYLHGQHKYKTRVSVPFSIHTNRGKYFSRIPKLFPPIKKTQPRYIWIFLMFNYPFGEKVLD